MNCLSDASGQWAEAHVRTYSGYMGDQRPTALCIDGTGSGSLELIDSWRDPEYSFYMVRTNRGSVFMLRHHRIPDRWQVYLGRIRKGLPKKIFAQSPELDTLD